MPNCARRHIVGWTHFVGIPDSLRWSRRSRTDNPTVAIPTVIHNVILTEGG